MPFGAYTEKYIRPENDKDNLGSAPVKSKGDGRLDLFSIWSQSKHTTNGQGLLTDGATWTPSNYAIYSPDLANVFQCQLQQLRLADLGGGTGRNTLQLLGHEHRDAELSRWMPRQRLLSASGVVARWWSDICR